VFKRGWISRELFLIYFIIVLFREVVVGFRRKIDYFIYVTEKIYAWKED
jgi:hypothetical protein